MLVLMFVMPLIQILILGNVLTTDIRNIPVEIVNGSSTRVAADIVQRLRAQSPIPGAAASGCRTTNWNNCAGATSRR